MSELKLETVLSYLGYEADKIKTEEDFKSNFETKFGVKENLLKDPSFTGKIFGQRLGSIETKLKANAKKMGIEFAPDELKDKTVEDIQELAFLKIADMNKMAMENLEKQSKGTVDDQVKAWKDKYKSVEDELKDTKNLLGKTSSEFDGFKQSIAQKSREEKINRFKTDAMSKLEFKQDISPVEKMGFSTVINEKYSFDLDEQEQFIIKDKTGNRIPSKKETGKFMGIDEILADEIIANKLVKINPQGGQRVAQPGSTVIPSAPSTEKPLYIHPRAMASRQSVDGK